MKPRITRTIACTAFAGFGILGIRQHQAYHWSNLELETRRHDSLWKTLPEHATLRMSAQDVTRLTHPTQDELHAGFGAVNQLYTRFGKDLSGRVGVDARPMLLIGLRRSDSCSRAAIPCHDRDLR